MTIGSLVEVFKALSDGTRQKLYRLLLHEELCVCELAAVFGVSQSAISQHLRRLKAVDLVQDRRRGQWVFYRGNARPLDDLARLLRDLKTIPPQDQPDLTEEGHHLLQVKRQNLCGIRTANGELDGRDGGRPNFFLPVDRLTQSSDEQQKEDVKA